MLPLLSNGSQQLLTLQVVSNRPLKLLLLLLLLVHVQGEMLPLLSGGSQQLLTDNSGQFTVDGPTAARFKFSRSYEHSRCVDSVTGVSIDFPMIQVG
jgi:hypothetical protein